MKLATRDDGTRDGALLIVRRDGAVAVDATDIARTMQDALDRWDEVEPALQARFEALQSGSIPGEPLDIATLHAPLPRAYEWVDGSAFISHIVLVRKARGAEPPETLRTEPLVYQGGSSDLLAPTQDIPLVDEAWGLDFEAEIVCILGDTPQGTTADKAAPYVKLVTLCNDITLRNLIPPELKKGFGFFVSKPASAFGPFAVTPDELGSAWQDGRVHLPMNVWWNDEQVGKAEAGEEMHFSFHDLVQHITKTRAFGAGTLLGSGTIANEDETNGFSCIAERRMRDILATGAPQTRFMQAGDTVRIEVRDAEGVNVFGTIAQTVVSA